MLQNEPEDKKFFERTASQKGQEGGDGNGETASDHTFMLSSVYHVPPQHQAVVGREGHEEVTTALESS